MRHSTWKIFLALVALCAVSALAAGPRVALIKIKSGSASIGGKAIHKAHMAQEGDVLKLDKGADVRIQLLGSSAELQVLAPDKPVEIVINKARLLKDSKKVERGGVAVAKDIGSLNTAGASITRSVTRPSDKLVKVKPGIPPIKEEGDYLIEFDGGESFDIPDSTTVKVDVYPKTGSASDSLSQEFTSPQRLITLAMPGTAIKVGEPYFFRLTCQYEGKSDESGLTYFYSETFRLLSPEQNEVLEMAKVELLANHEQSKDVLPLLRLASLYQDYDQNREALKYLQQAYESPHLKDPETKESIQKQIDRFQKGFDAAIPVTKAKD